MSLFFARLVVWVGDFLPENTRFTDYFCSVFNHEKCKQKVIAWHKAELEKLDPFFHSSVESHAESVRKRVNQKLKQFDQYSP